MWQRREATSSPSASPLLLPRRLTRNTPSPWRVAYTDAPLGPHYGTASETSTTTSTWSSAGPYFSDVTSEDRGDEDGRQMSCLSTSEMLSRLRVGVAQRAATGMRLSMGRSLTLHLRRTTKRLSLSSAGVGQSSIPPMRTAAQITELVLLFVQTRVWVTS